MDVLLVSFMFYISGSQTVCRESFSDVPQNFSEIEEIEEIEDQSRNNFKAFRVPKFY